MFTDCLLRLKLYLSSFFPFYTYTTSKLHFLLLQTKYKRYSVYFSESHWDGCKHESFHNIVQRMPLCVIQKASWNTHCIYTNTRAALYVWKNFRESKNSRFLYNINAYDTLLNYITLLYLLEIHVCCICTFLIRYIPI